MELFKPDESINGVHNNTPITFEIEKCGDGIKIIGLHNPNGTAIDIGYKHTLPDGLRGIANYLPPLDDHVTEDVRKYGREFPLTVDVPEVYSTQNSSNLEIGSFHSIWGTVVNITEDLYEFRTLTGGRASVPKERITGDLSTKTSDS